MRRQALTILLVALTIFSLSGCKKDKPEETTAPTLEVIVPEETEPEVLESAPVKGETLKIGDGKSLEELSKEAGIPVIETRAVEDESLSEDKKENSKTSAESTKSDNEAEKSNGSGENSSGAEGNTSEGKSNTEENKPSESNEQSNNGGDTEVIGIDQEVFNEMQDKYRQEAQEELSDPEVMKAIKEKMGLK